MRLVKVPEPPYFHARCLTCQQPILNGDKVADLDGKAFEAYYHNQTSCLSKGGQVTKMTITIKPLADQISAVAQTVRMP